jgi:hypothetical protein
MLNEAQGMLKAAQNMPSSLTWLRRLLLLCGLIDVLALAVLFLPAQTMADWQQSAGLGPFPAVPITSYLAKASSLMYVAHGVLLLFLSGHVARYLPVIRCLAVIALAHGTLLVFVGLFTGMPLWWLCLEGPLLATWGVVVLWLSRAASASSLPLAASDTVSDRSVPRR